MEIENNIGTQIKSRLEHMRMSPDDSVWANIEKKLKKKRRRRLAFLWWFSGASIIVASIITFLLIPNNTTTENQNFNSVVIEKTKPLRTKSTSSRTKTDTDTATNHSIISSIKNNNTQKFTSTSTNKNNTAVNNTKIAVLEVKTQTKENTEFKLNNTKTANQILDDKTAVITHKTNKLEDTEISITEEKTIKKAFDDNDLKEQTTEKDSIKTEDTWRWSITPQAIFSYYGNLNGSSNNNTTFNYGIIASYKMNAKLYARTGFRLLNLKQTHDNFTTNVAYYQFPVEIKYVPFQNKYNPYILVGFNYFSLKNAITNSNAEILKTTAGFNAGLGLETKLWKNTFLNTEAVFNYQIMPLSGQNKLKPHFINASLGIEYRF